MERDFDIWNLEAGEIRLADDAEARIGQDPSLVLEGIAIASQQDARLDERSCAVVREHAPLLSHADGMSIYPKLEQMLLGRRAGQTLRDFADVIAYAIPVIADMANCPQNSPYHVYDVLDHTAHVIDASPATPVSRWAALLHDSGKPQCRWTDKTGRDHFTGHAAVGADIADAMLTRVCAPAKLHAEVCTLVRVHEWFVPADDDGLEHALAEFGGDVDFYRALLALQVADSSAKSPAASRRLEHAQALQELLDAFLSHASMHRPM